IGVNALANNTAGSNNTAVGSKALKKSRGKNIAIGYQAGVTLKNGNNNIFIGNQGVGDESQTIHRHALLPDPWISDGLCPVARERAAAAFPPAPGHRGVPDELPGADLRVDGAARTEGSHQLAPAQGRAHRGAAPAA